MEWLTTLKARLIGSAIGSLIMIIYRPGHDTPYRLMVRMITGFVVGFVTAPVILYWLEWVETVDTMLFSATVGGSMGVIVVQALHSRWFRNYLRMRAEK